MSVLPRKSDLLAMRRAPGRDVVAGLTVAVVALPLALAFGIASGLGAEAGIATAVIAGVVAALLGGSHVQVSGPTGAMTVVLIPIVATHGRDGVLLVGLMAGLILVGLSLAGAGGFMRYLPLPVIEGFTIGIALVIGIQQLPNALGVHASGERVLLVAYDALVAWFESPHVTALAMTLGVTGAILVAARFRPGLPISLAAVAVATLVSSLAGLSLEVIGPMPSGLPGLAIPDFGLPLNQLLMPAVAVAALAALESLLSASVADAMRVGERHDPDRELFGQGVANLVVPFVGGVPATAAIARTAVNVRAGAQSRLAAVMQSVVLLAVVLGASAWVSKIPLAALAGVLIATAVQMVEVSSISALARASRSDTAVLVLTAGTTLLLDLVTAVILGLVVAGVFALRQMARTAKLHQVPLDDADHHLEELAVLDDRVVVFRLEGPLFFGAAHSFLLELTELSDVRVVVLRMSQLTGLDSTGAAVLADVIKRLEQRHVTVLLSGVQEPHARMLERLGVFDELAHEKHVFDRTPDAIAHALVHASKVAHP